RRAQGAGRAAARHPAPVPGGVGDPGSLRRAARPPGGGRLLLGPGHRPRQDHVHQLHRARAAVGGPAGHGRLDRRGPGGRHLSRRPRRGPGSRGGAEERMSSLARRAAARWPVLSGMREAVGMGLSALRAYKMRASLTILGVVMGIMTVTGMSSTVAGLNQSMATQIEGFGSAVIFVRPFVPGE